ncbi:hypothetical protein GCM10007147_15750 [Nocardiopsis kunsanensis]|uniref:Uncharacterized protein n=1 Tax=Nocardiopsis kunsanensis TaxID=141693 RepID=A0A918XB18_9ACTN|nr:hypothetical protein [Nocardiopsis kunsanensis]GHD21852.1 hypothetical protein GCM10007147_15750 [Nocardiopsis kunsanensis]
MSGPETGNTGDTTNTAGAGAFVGGQFGHVHDSDIYLVGPDAQPEDKYRVGLRYLQNGVPAKARDLITEAVADGHDSGEVAFHRVLSVLSKRSFRDLSSEDHQELRLLSVRAHTYPEDEWTKALDAVFVLLACLAGQNNSSEATVDALLALPSEQRRPIIHHLSLMITGGMKEGLWIHTVRDAEQTVHGNGRTERVWSYFEPVPIGARVREPKPSSTTSWDLFWASVWSVLLACCAGTIGWAALTHGGPFVLLTCLLAPVAGYFALHEALLWWHRNRLLQGGENRNLIKPRAKAPPKGGFADRVDHDFEHYFSKYAPEPAQRRQWLDETAAVRRALRDEVVHLYRESEVEAGRVRWLIRYMARDVRQRSRSDRPLDPRARHGAGAMTKARAVFFSALTAAGLMTVVVTALFHVPATAVGCLLLAGVGARFALPLWATLISESWRVREERRESEQIRKERGAEYHRWKSKLERLRPTEPEMEAWLNADKTLVLQHALSRHRLSWHEIVAHTFLHVADQPCRRAMVPGGAWRYSKYVIRLFLVTGEGVRDVEARLDFNKGVVGRREFEEFRFDTVSSVRVTEQSRISYTLYLTLNNGGPREITVSEPPTDAPEHEEEEGDVEVVNLDASGFFHTRRILEGIAAEGKAWISRDRDRRDHKRPGSYPTGTDEQHADEGTAVVRTEG